MKNKISILGQDYKIIVDTSGNNPKLNDATGYMEPWAKKIVIDGSIDKNDSRQVENLDAYVRKVYRHEVMHAFFQESGLIYKFSAADEELLVDWIAIQYPKIKKIFAEMGIED